jgi:hypothetical protein
MCLPGIEFRFLGSAARSPSLSRLFLYYTVRVRKRNNEGKAEKEREGREEIKRGKEHGERNKKFREELIACFPPNHIENDASNNAPIIACICCRGNVYTGPIDRWEAFMK